MDPFSITAGAVGLADVCVRVTSYLKDIKDAAGRVARDIQDIITEVNHLRDLSKLVEDTWSKFQHEENVQLSSRSSLRTHSEHLCRSLTECRRLIDELEANLDEIAGKSGRKVSGKRDGLIKAFRLQSKDKGMAAIRQRIWTNRQSLSLFLQIVTLYAHLVNS